MRAFSGRKLLAGSRLKPCCVNPPAQQRIPMTKLQDSQAGSTSHTHESRQHPRRKLVGIAYVELAQDNGGILLNLSEGGLAVQSALALSSREFPELRFQLPHMRGWLTASGRVAWISESKKEAGIQFLDLHEHARTQIRSWLGKEEEDPLRAEELGAVAPIAEVDSRNVDERENWARARTSGPRGNGQTSSQARPEREVRLGAGATAQQVGTTAHDDARFQFHNYSMFAAEESAGVPWVEPARPKRSWGSFALFAVLLAALFFVLGAMIGRDNLNGIVASVGGWKEGQTPPNVKPPSAPEQSAVNSSSDTQVPSGEAQTPSRNATTGEADQRGNNSENAAERSSGTAQQQSEQQSAKAPAEPSAATVQNRDGAESSRKAENTPSPEYGATIREPKAKVEKSWKTARRDANYSGADAGEPIEYGRSILVNPPAPGSPPFFVNLTGEAVSASSSVAISARRSIQVPPRTDGDAYSSERVMIGKLMAHSDPFYPLEARNKRIEGIVELHALVGRSGQVINVTPVSGPGLLVPAGVAALREWRYEPTFINGDPVETHVDVTMVFRSP